MHNWSKYRDYATDLDMVDIVIGLERCPASPAVMVCGGSPLP